MWFGTPYSSDMWDPFSSGTIWTADQYRGSGDETAALAHAHVDWQETDTAHIFHADLPGFIHIYILLHFVKTTVFLLILCTHETK